MHECVSEVLVIGAGPAGLAAAAAAAADGADVLVVDENARPGGQIWRAERDTGVRSEAGELVALAMSHGARFLSGTAVFDAASGPTLFAVNGQRPLVLRTQRVVLALGATERQLPFPGWTLPGVFGVGGLQALGKNGMDVSNRRIAVAGSGPLLLAVAAWLERHDAKVLGVFEQAPKADVMRFGRGLWRHPAKLMQAVHLSGSLVRVPRHHDAWPVRAEGRAHVERLVVSVGGRELTLGVDYVACAFGFAPVTGLAALLGCAIDDAGVQVDGLQRTNVEGVLCAGESTGIAGADCARAEGVVAGHMAAGREDLACTACRWRDRARRFGTALERTFALRDELRSLATTDTIVCRCEDVPWSMLVSREDERDAKLQTRVGMGPCQGRVCGAALAFLKGWPRSRVRPPLIPVTMDVLAEVGAARHRLEEPAL
jgi:NADPH-dependent 2,4-dienoyl-CoA reductase/sulfur reductase-like enzyme